MKILVKNISIALAMLFVIVSCGKENTENNPNEEEEKVYSEVGVWESGNYFISFSSDGFLTSYVASDFIDCGSYTKSADKVITCNNLYFSHSTTYAVQSLDDEKMTVKISYQDVDGNSKSTSLTLTKSSKTPSAKESNLVGKMYTYLKSGYGHITFQFTNYYSATKTSDKTNIAKYPLSLFYIYFNGYCYFQTFNTAERVGLIGGWNQISGTGEITVYKFSFNSNGSISDFEDVSSTLL